MSSPSKIAVDSFEQAKELLAEGKRDLLVYAIPDAVSNCSKACELMAKQKGEMSKEAAEAYLYYGKALLELSRVESGVLGNALDGVDMESKPADEKDALVEDTEAMTTDEKSEIEEKVAVALDENYDKHDLVARAHSGDITEDSEDEAMEEDDAEMVDDKKVDTEVSNLEQAWQMFDLSKVIYAKSGEIVKECEALILLAEVSMENSNFNQAVEDLTECLAKRIKSLPSDSRMIAETHYQLGVAQAHCAQQCADQSQQCSLFDNAEKSLTSAVDVLNNTMASLKKMESSDVTDKELAELTSLCAEIEERKNDHKEMQKGTYKEEKDFVSIYKGIEVNEIATKKAVSST